MFCHPVEESRADRGGLMSCWWVGDEGDGRSDSWREGGRVDWQSVSQYSLHGTPIRSAAACLAFLVALPNTPSLPLHTYLPLTHPPYPPY
ncbi:MAG: hypothetical protein GY820_46200 [Gammaproteobacteria bacterium]|nr:hypothetical protein [Gammaproteobacteria bacterium]